MTLVKRVRSQYGVETMEPVNDVQITPPVTHNCLTDGHLYAHASNGLHLLGLENGDCIGCRKSAEEISIETLNFEMSSKSGKYSIRGQLVTKSVSDELIDNCEVAGVTAACTDFGRQLLQDNDPRMTAERSDNAFLNNQQLMSKNDELVQRVHDLTEKLTLITAERNVLAGGQKLMEQKIAYLGQRCEAHAKTIAGMQLERGPGIKYKPEQPIQTCHMGDYYED